MLTRLKATGTLVNMEQRRSAEPQEAQVSFKNNDDLVKILLKATFYNYAATT